VASAVQDLITTAGDERCPRRLRNIKEPAATLGVAAGALFLLSFSVFYFWVMWPAVMAWAHGPTLMVSAESTA
jgi:hypothetical protein